jgi:hypothetical protein
LAKIINKLKKPNMTFCAALLLSLTLVLLTIAQQAIAVPVQFVGFSFIQGERLANFTIRQLETGAEYNLDHNGELTVDFDVGSNISFLVPEQKDHNGKVFESTQTAILQVPPEGLATPLTAIALQVPRKSVYEVMSFLSNGKKDPTKCQVVATVCNVNRSWYSSPQGLPGTKAFVTPAAESLTFYFGTWGRLSNDTNPLPNNRTTSSWDGGVVFENIPVSNETENVSTATHPGYTFSQAKFKCMTPGQFINAAPNQGPRATPLPGHRFRNNKGSD